MSRPFHDPLDGYVVVKDIIDEAELNPIRTFIKMKVAKYARDQHADGKLSSLYENSYRSLKCSRMSDRLRSDSSCIDALLGGGNGG